MNEISTRMFVWTDRLPWFWPTKYTIEFYGRVAGLQELLEAWDL